MTLNKFGGWRQRKFGGISCRDGTCGGGWWVGRPSRGAGVGMPPQRPTITLGPTHTLSWVTLTQISSLVQGCTNCGSLAAWLRGNGQRMRKGRENEEMEGDSLSTFPHFLFISSLSIHYLYQKLSHFVAKCFLRHFCCKKYRS